MTTLQIAMTDEEYLYIKALLHKAQGSFQLDGNKYPMGKTIIKVLEEWSRGKDFIKETQYSREKHKALTLFMNDPDEVERALSLIKFVEKSPNETNTKTLYELIVRLEPHWVAPMDNMTKSIIIKMRELLG